MINKITTNVKNAYLKNDTQALKNFYEDGLKHPSMALILERNFIKNTQDEMAKDFYGYTQFNNLEYKYRCLKNDKDIKTQFKNFWNTFRKLYPKTGIIITVLCINDRLKSDYTTPKADFFTKNFLDHQNKTLKKYNLLTDNYSDKIKA